MKLPTAAILAHPVSTKVGFASMDFPVSPDTEFDDLLASASDQVFQNGDLTEVTLHETIDALLPDESISTEYMMVQTEAVNNFTPVQFSLPTVNILQKPIEVGMAEANPDGKSNNIASPSMPHVSNPLHTLPLDVGEQPGISAPVVKPELTAAQIAGQISAQASAHDKLVAKFDGSDLSTPANGSDGNEGTQSQQPTANKETFRTLNQLPGLDRLANTAPNTSGIDPRQTYAAKSAPIVTELYGSGVKLENVSVLKPSTPQSGTVSQQVPVFATVVPHEVAPLVARVSAAQISQPTTSLLRDVDALPSTKQATSIELQLVPRTLGVVDVKISSNVPGQLNIEIKTQTAEAETLMRNEMSSIREALRSLGLSFDDLRVNVQQHAISDPGQNRSSNADGFGFMRDGAGEHLSHSSEGRSTHEGPFSEDDQAESPKGSGEQQGDDRVRTGLYL